jgi:hypothetical protein
MILEPLRDVDHRQRRLHGGRPDGTVRQSTALVRTTSTVESLRHSTRLDGAALDHCELRARADERRRAAPAKQ